MYKRFPFLSLTLYFSLSLSIYIYIYIYISVYAFVYVYMYLCVCERGRELKKAIRVSNKFLRGFGFVHSLVNDALLSNLFYPLNFELFSFSIGDFKNADDIVLSHDIKRHLWRVSVKVIWSLLHTKLATWASPNEIEKDGFARLRS